MAALNAITNDALLSIVEWGESALRAPGGGETAHVLPNVAGVDEAVIAAERPQFTKVVATAATAMTAGEKAAVEAAAAAAAAGAVSDESLNYKQASANVASVPSVAGVCSYDCLTGNDFRTVMTENIATVSLLNPPASGKGQIIRIVFVQGASSYTLPGSWADVDWWTGGAGAPVMPTAAGDLLLVTIYSNGSETLGAWAAE